MARSVLRAQKIFHLLYLIHVSRCFSRYILLSWVCILGHVRFADEDSSCRGHRRWRTRARESAVQPGLFDWPRKMKDKRGVEAPERILLCEFTKVRTIARYASGKEAAWISRAPTHCCVVKKVPRCAFAEWKQLGTFLVSVRGWNFKTIGWTSLLSLNLRSLLRSVLKPKFDLEFRI